MNRPPGPRDPWFQQHQQKCGGTFVKVSEPQKPKPKTKQKSEKKQNTLKDTNQQKILTDKGDIPISSDRCKRKCEDVSSSSDLKITFPVSASLTPEQKLMQNFIQKRSEQNEKKNTHIENTNLKNVHIQKDNSKNYSESIQTENLAKKLRTGMTDFFQDIHIYPEIVNAQTYINVQNIIFKINTHVFKNKNKYRYKNKNKYIYKNDNDNDKATSKDTNADTKLQKSETCLQTSESTDRNMYTNIDIMFNNKDIYTNNHIQNNVYMKQDIKNATYDDKDIKKDIYDIKHENKDLCIKNEKKKCEIKIENSNVCESEDEIEFVAVMNPSGQDVICLDDSGDENS